jgi:thioredoxin domain-containing protein 5
MEYLTPPVAYLDANDFDDDGNLINKQLIDSNLPVFIMIQAIFCGHCTKAKPWFQEFAQKNVGKVICCSIQGDSDMKSVKELTSMLNKICSEFVGYPTYVVFNKNKKIKYTGGRKTEDLQSFLNQLY